MFLMYIIIGTIINTIAYLELMHKCLKENREEFDNLQEVSRTNPMWWITIAVLFLGLSFITSIIWPIEFIWIRRGK